jgi:regulator of replication initiation timing
MEKDSAEFRKTANNDLDEKITRLGNAIKQQAEESGAKFYELKRKIDEVVEENKILHILEDEPAHKNGLLRRIFK